MVSLLDVNVLIALAWPNHVHHVAASRWFIQDLDRPWSTCHTTETGFVRISANPRVLDDPVDPRDAIDLLEALRGHGRHQYWDAARSVVDLDPDLRGAITGHRQVTDACLIQVARDHGGVVATFDRGLDALDPSHARILPV